MGGYILAFAVTAVACGESTSVEIDLGASLLEVPQEVTLRIGEEVQVTGSVLRVTFVRVVEDSRCPIDVTCVWAGNAVVEVSLAAGMGPSVPIQLNTHLEPRTRSWNAVVLRVLDLQPAPRASVPTEPGDYVLSLRLEPER